MLVFWTTFLSALAGHSLHHGVECAPTPYTVHIGTQAQVVGYEYDVPAGIIFLGIPYAQSRTPENRFSPPERKDPAGRMLAFHYGSVCVQTGTVTNQDEDCLFLNIYAPKMINTTQNRYPVLFWIPGGAYQKGSGGADLGSDAPLKSIVKRGVIMVSINYRLGAFGFFSTRDPTVPGNMGLMDQIEALNWVKRYISYFGGDPNRITISGHSAGSMSVSLLTLSPRSQNLFQQALAESGSGFSTSYMSNFYVPKEDASKTMAINVGCTTDAQWEEHNPAQMAQMVQCLRSKTAADIVNAKFSSLYIPVIDGPGGVLPENLHVLAQRRPPIPILLGNCHDEHLLGLLTDGLLHNASYVNRFSRDTVTKGLEHSHYLMYYNNSQLVEQAIQSAYLSNVTLDDQDHIGWCNLMVKMYTELVFIGPTYRDAMWFSQTNKNSPVYLYSFDYIAPGALPDVNPRLKGVIHGWELQYQFGYAGTTFGGWKVTDDDLATEDFFIQFWTDFIKHGNPTPAGSSIVWPQLGTNGEYMIMGPRPTPTTGFQTRAQLFACTVPAIEGIVQLWCT